MKTKIRPIGYKALFSLLLICTVAGCRDEQRADGDLPFDATARIEINLEGIMLDNGDEPDTRANIPNTTPLANGESFRLYVMKRNSTEILTSYTYTMKVGLPVMDTGQGDGKLYLPYGELDIYLASPVSVATSETEGADNKPVMAPVAAPMGVIPRQGVDLLASCTPITVSYTEKNTLTPVPLKHKMAKVKVRVKNKYPDRMPLFNLVKVALYNQSPDIGEYTFDNSDGGRITPTIADEVAGVEFTKTDIVKVKENDEFYTTFMMLPREPGKIKVEMELNVRPSNEGVAQLYRMSGIIENTALVGGKQNLFFTQPVVSQDIVWRPSLLPWNDQEVVSKPMNDLVFYLDGRDTPEYINGKLCWRDRSGNNNHAELSGNVTYNNKEFYYDLPTSADILKLPALGMIPDYTLEMVVSSAPINGYALYFSNEDLGKTDSPRDLFLHLPFSDNKIYFDAGSSTTDAATGGRISGSLLDDVYSHSFRTYQFRKSNSNNKSSIYINGTSFVAETTNNYDHKAFLYNQIGGKAKLKIRSVRLYRKYLKDEEVKKNYEADNSVYKQDASIVTNGLLFYFDGKTPPYTNATGETYWPDLAEGKMRHAKFVHKDGKNHIVHTGLGYRFDNTSAASYSCMDLNNGVLGAKIPEFTLEILLTGTKNDNTAFNAQSNSGGRVIGITVPHIYSALSSYSSIYFDAPYNSGTPKDRCFYDGPEATLGALSSFQSIVFTRSTASGVTKKIMIDGKLLQTQQKASEEVALIEKMRIGAFGESEGLPSFYYSGEIRAIRLYGRVLSELEIIQNNLSDRARYKY